MDCKFSIAELNDVDLLVTLRMEFIKEFHPDYSEEMMNEIIPETKQYISNQMNQGMYIGFFGKINNEVVCSSGLVVYYLPPLKSNNYRKVGYILNFLTRSDYRSCGYGSQLMEYIKAYAKENGFHSIILHSTDMGYQLYSKCGFKDSDKAMELILQ